MSCMRALFTAIVCGCVAHWLPAAAETWTPDHDGNGFNNSIERAVDVGTLTPNGVNLREQLGKVPWGFDSRDFYRFALAGSINDWELSVHLDENPPTTMWLEIYDQSGKSIYVSRGAADEDFKLPIGAGIYYVEVKTEPDVARDRNLTYTLTMKPRQVPLPELGGTACTGAPMLGALGNQPTIIEGSLNEMKPSSFYAIFVPYGLALDGGMFGPGASGKYTVSAIDRLDGTPILFRNSAHQNDGLLLDPGFYCLKIESVGATGLGNYRGQFVARNAGLVPGRDRDRAQKIADMELGNLTENGKYGLVSRYIHYQQIGVIPNVPSVLQDVHEYVVRDWVGTTARTQFYWFDLAQARRVELRLYNLMSTARAFVEDSSGKLLAATTSNGTSFRDDLLPMQTLIADLPAGRRYYLRIEYLSDRNPGTPFALWLRASPPS